MNTLAAIALGNANRGKPHMVFDWCKAARLIRERTPRSVSAGLAGDWEYTGGTIWQDGAPVKKEDTYVYLASTWATPEIEMDGYREDCYVMEEETDGWGADTFWPEQALALLNSPA